jgi:sugar fermentation stimulation protein A
MKYNKIIKGTFVERPNRFVAYVNIDGKEETVHVKNTGRCKELLVKGATVYLSDEESITRKTKYDLICVEKQKRLINIDSQAPNKIFEQWVRDGKFLKDITKIKPECKYKNSRFDFYIETKTQKVFVEVKGVTLEENGVVKFPDAPTLRGIKHINELVEAKDEGYECYVVFIIQMANVKHFEPNYKTHKEFGEALERAKENGVNILALDCSVTPDSVEVKNSVTVKI